MKFNKTELIKDFVNKLCDITLLPKPHLNVLNGKYPESNKKGMFTISDKPASQNLIGYDFVVKPLTNDALTITNFDFYFRDGYIKPSVEKDIKNFIHIGIKAATNLKNRETDILIKNLDTGEVILEDKFEEKYKTKDNAFSFRNALYVVR